MGIIGIKKWKEISYHILMSNGINTQGNFPQLDIINNESKLPYVREIADFPLTDTLILGIFLIFFYQNTRKNVRNLRNNWLSGKMILG